ncbi:MAG: hypothetical protein ACREDF_04560 [Thermoplasmata archaeon]
MFGNTYPIFGHEKGTSERIRDRDLRDYVRWEYPPADRVSVILSARRAATWSRRAPSRKPRTLLRRLQIWMTRRRNSPEAALPSAEATLPEGDVAGGELRPTIDVIVPLADARKAFDHDLGDQRAGKIVLRVADG